MSIALVFLVLAGFFNLLSWLEALLYQRCRIITCSLPMSKQLPVTLVQACTRWDPWPSLLSSEMSMRSVDSSKERRVEGLPKQVTSMLTLNTAICLSLFLRLPSSAPAFGNSNSWVHFASVDRVLGLQQPGYMYYVATQNTALILVQCSVLAWIALILEEPNPAFIEVNDRTSMKPNTCSLSI